MNTDEMGFLRLMEKGHGSDEPWVIKGNMKLEDRG
jgi:hypothetical protein